jgi:hypothetical protein
MSVGDHDQSPTSMEALGDVAWQFAPWTSSIEQLRCRLQLSEQTLALALVFAEEDFDAIRPTQFLGKQNDPSLAWVVYRSKHFGRARHSSWAGPD